MCENKDADQLISVFVFAIRIVQSLYYLNPKFQAFNHSSVAVQPGLCWTRSEIPKTGFLTTRLICNAGLKITEPAHRSVVLISYAIISCVDYRAIAFAHMQKSFPKKIESLLDESAFTLEQEFTEYTRAVPKVLGHDLIMLFLEIYSNKCNKISKKN